MSLYDVVAELIDRSYSFEKLRYKVANMLEQDNIYISADDIQAIMILKSDDHIAIDVYLRTIEIFVNIYKNEDRIYTSILPLIRCECGGG
jgi:hypothetical protein